MPTVQLLTVLGTAGLVICLASLIALHLLPTGFRPVPDPVSNYAVSRYGFLYRLQAFGSGVAGLCLVAIFGLTSSAFPLGGLVALACYALARLLIPFFPTDIKPPRTRTGTIHIILAIFTFAGIATATVLLTASVTSLTSWAPLGASLQAAALLTCSAAILFLIIFAIRPLRPILGLVERLIYLGTLLWLGLVFGRLLL